MGGVVIGSTMELVAGGQQWGAVMINTACNMKCPTCYLGAGKAVPVQNQTMSLDLAGRLANLSDLDGVAIIGTEPLLDDQSIDVINAFCSKIKTHIITNGLNLARYAKRIKVSRIDISLDGGPKTYSRNGSFEVIQRGVEKWRGISSGEVFALHILHEENISNIRDMLEGSRLLGVKQTFFSPYVKTLGGYAETSPVKTTRIVQALRPFIGEQWKLLLDPYHAIFEWREWEVIKQEVEPLGDNLLLIDFDPGDRVRRITIDGSEKHPFMALHPGIKLAGKKII